MSEIIKSYKGFDKDLRCRGFQYEVGKEYEEDEAVACETGFHACENPLDVFKYYPPSNARYCEVEQSGDISKKSGDSKVASTKIKIGAEIGLNGLIKAGVEFILDKVKFDNPSATGLGEYSAAIKTGYGSAATNTDHSSVAMNTGDKSVATNTGEYSTATNEGRCSIASNTNYGSASMNAGEFSIATNIGNNSIAMNTGYYSVATNLGDRSVATSTGNHSVSVNTGHFSAAEATGNNSIAIVTRNYSKARGALGCWLVLTERNDETGDIVAVKAVKVTGRKIKADTWYTLKDGKVVEWED